jgi:uncharacterized protein YgbK (DUF1537 family)
LIDPEPILAETLLSQLPPIWPDPGLRSEIRGRREASRACVVAFDDDPTGTQSVAGVHVLHHPRPEDLDRALESGEPAFYLLTNTRSLPSESAVDRTRALATEVSAAARRAGRPIIAVSRSDSTLRGHFPAETQALAGGLGLDPAVLLLPYFAEGGRFTIHDVHWVQEGDRLVPAAQTAFARDPVFGYASSRLPDWVEEKTAGRVLASAVKAFPIDVNRTGGPEAARRWLETLAPGEVGIVNAAHDRDLEVVAAALRADDGERLVFRSAASWVKVLAGLPDPLPLQPSKVVAGRAGAGLTVVGSVVPRTDEQLAALADASGLIWVELQVNRALDGSLRHAEMDRVIEAILVAWSAGQDVLVHTTRARRAPQDLHVGQVISAALVEVVRRLPQPPRYLVAKGGITASDIATQALGMRSSLVLGPILPGVPVWEMGPETLWPGLRLVVFPGNVGAPDALARLLEALRCARPEQPPSAWIRKPSQV